MKAFLIFLAVANLVSGWIPTETNNMDFISTLLVCSACYVAYIAGTIK